MSQNDGFMVTTGIEPGLQEPESVTVTTVPNEISLSFARFLQYFNTAVPGDPGNRSHTELQGITNIRVLEYSCMSWSIEQRVIMINYQGTYLGTTSTGYLIGILL